MCLAMRREGWIIAALGLLAAACGTTSLPQPPPPDRPVPASEPRANVSARVDLEPARDCEEAFDLAVYQNRAIELIAWDDRIGACSDRHVDVRYLSGRASQNEVMETLRRHAVRVTVDPGKVSDDAATK